MGIVQTIQAQDTDFHGIDSSFRRLANGLVKGKDQEIDKSERGHEDKQDFSQQRSLLA